MARIIDRSFVEQDQVLVGRSAAYVESARGFAHRFHARQRQHHFQRVGFAEDDRNGLDDIHADFFDSQLGRPVL